MRMNASSFVPARPWPALYKSSTSVVGAQGKVHKDASLVCAPAGSAIKCMLRQCFDIITRTIVEALWVKQFHVMARCLQYGAITVEPSV